MLYLKMKSKLQVGSLVQVLQGVVFCYCLLFWFVFESPSTFIQNLWHSWKRGKFRLYVEVFLDTIKRVLLNQVLCCCDCNFFFLKFETWGFKVI